MTNERRVLVHPDWEALVASVAARFLTKIIDVLEEKDEIHIVLTGGTTIGDGVLGAINASPARDTVAWSRVHFWWGDERWLPAGDPERNDEQAFDALLSHIALDPAKVHRFAASDAGLDLEAAAAAYADELAAATEDERGFPVFEIMFLGVGPDGHVASLFPGKDEVLVRDRTVVAVRGAWKAPSERLSLTLPVINASERLWMALAGGDKASVLGLALAGASVDEVPVAGVRGRKRTVFFVDQEASAEVPESLIAPSEEFHALVDQNR